MCIRVIGRMIKLMDMDFIIIPMVLDMKVSGLKTNNTVMAQKHGLVRLYIKKIQFFKKINNFLDGAKYVGYYNMGRKHGKGKFLWADGSTYEGEF